MARSRTLYRVAASLAIVCLLLGIGRMVREERISRIVLWQLIVSLLVLRIALTMYRRNRRGG